MSDPVAEFFVPSYPPSVNEMYATVKDRWTGKMRRVKSQEAESKLALFAVLAPPMKLEKAWYRLHLTFFMNLLCKNGEPRIFDASNHIKGLEDILMKKWCLDDKFILDSWASKAQQGQRPPGTLIVLRKVAEVKTS